VNLRERAWPASADDTPVTVAVVSWNTRELLLRCLGSLAADVESGRAEAWVLDNASTDGSATAARRFAPWARVIDNDANVGFGRAVNEIARRTRGEWLLAVNADAALEPGALGGLVTGGEDPRVGAVAPRLVLPTGVTQHSVHPFPTVPLTLAFNLGLHRLSARIGDRLCLEEFWDPERARVVPWAIGACLLLRRAAFDAVGGFDERQWMYAEDLDLGWRLAQRGWTTRFEPRARVRHESGAATGPAFGDQQRSRFLAATYAMLATRRGAMRMRATAAINIAGASGRVAWMTPLAWLAPRWRRPRAENRLWLQAHLEAVRAASKPVSPA
jgi:N-acetylglucosaminyl-diphospho-decaprenol L-rhamnosyltransferase